MGCRLVLHTGFRASGVAGFCWMMGSGLDWIGLDWIGLGGLVGFIGFMGAIGLGSQWFLVQGISRFAWFGWIDGGRGSGDSVGGGVWW